MPADLPQCRRPRTVFHYKVDEDLRPDDREAYLALLRDARTRIDDAHRWLLARGYALSRSAVARHRRRLLSAEADRRADLDRALAFARLAGAPDAPDFAAGSVLQLQHLVFQRLLDAGDPEVARDDDDDDEPDRPPQPPRLTPADLLTLSKLVAQCLELTRHLRAHEASVAPHEPSVPAPRTDADLREEIEAILAGRK